MKINVIEYIDMPVEIRNAFRNYYADTDHREILNDSYSRYPYLSNFNSEDFVFEYKEQILEYLRFIRIDATKEPYIIIHWDW